MEWLGHPDSEMVRHYLHLHDEEPRRQMDRLDPFGNTAGNQPPGNDTGAENQHEEEASSPDQEQNRGEDETE